MPKIFSDFLWEYLANHGVKHVFLLPGGGCMYLVDALVRNPRIVAVPLLHEQSVGIAAESYAQYKNSLGVALVTTGPGGTNALTACAAAWTDSTPMIFISGQVKTLHSKDGTNLRQKGFQEIPIVEMVKSITKGARTPKTPKDSALALRELHNLAISGRPGPVWLDIPLDIQNGVLSKIESEENGSTSRDSVTADKTDIYKLAEEWRLAKRPILVVGNGVRLSGAKDSLKELAISMATPVMLTWKAIDFFGENFSLNAGRPGTTAQPWANISIQNADLVIIIGARLDMGQVAYRAENFARNAKVTVVDIDEAELSKFRELDWRIIKSDAAFLVNELLKMKINRKHDSVSWISEINKIKQEFPFIKKDEKLREDEDGVSNYLFLDQLSGLLVESDIIVPGSSGACSEVTMQAYKVKEGQRIINSQGLGAMGFGIPASIGAHLASGRRTICIDGDGGFMMNIQDLATVVGRNLDIKFFVQNNNGYESIRITQRNLFSGRYIGVDRNSGIYIPELHKIASGFGIPYYRISANNEISDVLQRVLNTSGPSITELKISSLYESKYKVSSFISDSGTIESYPFEDMTPAVSLESLQRLVRGNLLPESLSRIRRA
jgi:acetolactate synthase-1/2/3 large subunit